MERTGISQAFVDFMHASEIEKSQKSNFLSFVQLVKEMDLGYFYAHQVVI